MNANVSPEERFLYWMLGLNVVWMAAYTLLTHWLTQPIAGAIVAFVGIVAARFLPGAKRVSAAKTVGLALAGAVLVFAAVTLIGKI
jgi:hypothetical protein